MRFYPVSQDALLVELANLDETLALFDSLQQQPIHGVEELVPAARTVLVCISVLARSAAKHLLRRSPRVTCMARLAQRAS